MTEAKFKAGDKVRAVLGTSLLKIGSEHTVLRSYKRGPIWSVDVSGQGPNWGYGEAHFELLSAPEPSATAGEGKLTVGCRVRIDRISRESLIPDDMLSWTGVVTDMSPDLDDGSGRIEIRTDEDTCTWYICPRDLTVLARKPNPAEQPKPDPYRARGLAGVRPESDADVLAYERELTLHMRREDMLPSTLGGLSRRDKLVAALKSEQQQSKPFAPRFPSVGRDSRVFGERRWGEK